jgi:hypothetical protein
MRKRWRIGRLEIRWLDRPKLLVAPASIEDEIRDWPTSKIGGFLHEQLRDTEIPDDRRQRSVRLLVNALRERSSANDT